MSNCSSGSLNGERTQRGSTGSSSTRDNVPNRPKKFPNYLRASTGSCHEMCKYGGHRDKETRKPLQKIWPKPSTSVQKSVDRAVPVKPKLEKAIDTKTAASGVSVSGKKPSVSLTAPFLTASNKARENGRLKSSAPLSHGCRMRGVEMDVSNSEDSEKTLHIIKTGTEINTDMDANAIPPSLSLDIDAEVIKHRQPVKDRSNRTSRNRQGIVSDNSPPNPFRDQKEVAPQQVNNMPQILSLRAAEILEVENVKKHRNGDDADDPGLIPYLKVDLKHQEVQRKEERQGLLNDVIEETANKLLLNRKGKVKALVGAFEVVISLQEGNTCLHNVS